MEDYFGNIDSYINGELSKEQQSQFELAIQGDESLMAEVSFRQTLANTLKWKRQVKIAHQTMLANQQSDNIDNYVIGAMDKEEFLNFEKELEEDKSLKEELSFREDLAKTLQWKRQIQTAHQTMVKKEGFVPIDDKIETPIISMNTTDKNKTVPITQKEAKRISFRRILSYAAMLIPGFILGTIFTNNELPVDSGYGGSGNDAVTLYDKESSVIKIGQQNQTLLTNDATKLQIIITEMDNSEEKYSLTEDFLEVIFDKDYLPYENLENANIQLFLEKIDEPNLQIALLKINQDYYSIPFSQEDFKRLFE